MRLNKYIALHTAHSRRQADNLIQQGKVTVNGQPAETGYDVGAADIVAIEGTAIESSAPKLLTVMFHKPRGYVCSRNGQGSKTVYELLPPELHQLNPVGRLDKDSSGLLLLTNNGALANQLTHPRYQKTKVYEVQLDKPLAPLHQQMITDHGIQLDDGLSRCMIERLDNDLLRITMQEGRNRQIRRTFAALGYTVTALHRITFGAYSLNELPAGKFKEVT